MADPNNRKSRWYEFKFDLFGPSFFTNVPIGDDLMTVIKEHAAAILSDNEEGDRDFQLAYLAEASDCRACRENEPGQRAHADYGGCLYVSSQSSQEGERQSDQLQRKRSRTASNGSLPSSSSLSI